MTKPEGPAQEPQVTFEKIDVCPFCFARYTIGPVSGRCYTCNQFIEHVPATLAPSQPAVTLDRETFDRTVRELTEQTCGISCGHRDCDSIRELLALLRAAEQK